jgi:hypothetical protein
VAPKWSWPFKEKLITTAERLVQDVRSAGRVMGLQIGSRDPAVWLGSRMATDLAGWSPLHHLRFSADIILRELTPAFQDEAAA